MVEVRHGLSSKPVVTDRLLGYFTANQSLEGILYIGYPILFTAGESVIVDALWVSEQFGIIIFNLIDGQVPNKSEIVENQDKLFDKVEAMLVGYPHLKEHRKFVGKIDVITFAPLLGNNDLDSKIVKDDLGLNELIKNYLLEWSESTKELFTAKVSIVQSIINLKSAPKRNILRPDSKGASMKILENAMSTLDADQEKAVIETSDGIQRIRGLAGSGKTIVLALKAAYLHALHPEWSIAVTFNSRSLKKQFETLLNIFSIQRTGYPFDSGKVHIIHAWGSSKQGAGIYYNFCLSHNITFFSVNDALAYRKQTGQYGLNILEISCDKALRDVSAYNEVYDVILVDEAQDLSISFLKMCFNILDVNKRLIYAYDELQTLDEGSSLPKPYEIFGQEASKDTILQVCYRNSRPILVTAHALGFGIYRNPDLLKDNEPKLVQFFDEPQLWSDLGYKSEGEDLIHGKSIVLSRTDKSSPSFLESHASDLIDFKSFSSEVEQAKWVADAIADDIHNEELLHKDILIINPVSHTTTGAVSEIRSQLFHKNINSHIAGAFNPDIFLEDNSIAISGIRRAKGNEVPMVYIINTQDCFSGESLMKLRNILFTAITRSKAWVRILGIGSNMDNLITEIIKVRDSQYKLKFIYPTAEEIDKMNVIHREKTENEVEEIHKATTLFDEVFEIIDKIKSGDANLEDYPIKIQKKIEKLL